MTLGYLNQSLYEGNITYVNIADNEKDYWRIPIGGIRIGDTAIGIVSCGISHRGHYTAANLPFITFRPSPTVTSLALLLIPVRP